MMNKSFMRLSLNLVLLVAAIVGLGSHASSADQVLSIPADTARLMTITGQAKDIIVANPAIVDITLQAPDHFILIGKIPGRTTLMILGPNQEVLVNTMVVVSEGNGGLVTVRGPRGGTMSQDAYACAERCTLIPGSNIGGSNGGGSLGSGPGPSDASAKPAPDPNQVTKVDTNFKMKMSPNGTVTGTETRIPQYGTGQ